MYALEAGYAINYISVKNCRIVLNAFKKRTVIMKTPRQKIYFVYLRKSNCFFT